MGMIRCCYGCEERYSNCHSECDRYKKEKAKLEDIKKKERLKSEINRYTIDTVNKWKKKKNDRDRRHYKIK